MNAPDLKLRNKTYYETHKEQIKAYREANKEQIRTYQKWYYQNINKKSQEPFIKKKEPKKPTEKKIRAEKPKPVQKEDVLPPPRLFEIKHGTFFLSFS